MIWQMRITPNCGKDFWATLWVEAFSASRKRESCVGLELRQANTSLSRDLLKFVRLDETGCERFMDCSTDLKPKLTDVGARLRAQWQLKLVAIPIFVTAFFAAYFALLRYPVFPVTEMPITAVDRWVPFQPWTLAAYYSLWGYVSLAPALMERRSQLFAHAKLAAGMSMVGLSIFLFWPTAVPLGAGLSNQDSAALQWLKEVDAAGNACPSLHVAFAVFAWLWLRRLLAEIGLPAVFKIFNALWCLAIVYSTLATKQHVLTDVIAGAFLGFAAGSIKPRVAEPPASTIVARSLETSV